MKAPAATETFAGTAAVDDCKSLVLIESDRRKDVISARIEEPLRTAGRAGLIKNGWCKRGNQMSARTYLVGCFGWRQHAVNPGLSALTATGLALLSSEVLKLSTNRLRPYTSGSTGEFWEGGNSFPSGHTTAGWAVASSLAHSYPQHRWVKWAPIARR